MFLDKSSNETLKKTDSKVYELIGNQPYKSQNCHQYHKDLFVALQAQDKQVYDLITQEYDRRFNTIQLQAAENQCSRAVLAALGSIVQNKTTEGFAGARYHGGCDVIDRLETLACQRAKQAFVGAQYANVQPHSGSQANQIVITALLKPGEKILSMDIEHGGHYSHGSQTSFVGRFFEVENYYLDRNSCLLDYDAIKEKALSARPKLIICGASAYSRAFDFEKFREIADSVGAYLLADISHICGLVIAGAHSSPVDCAHFTTTSTYKPGGPRGGLVLMGKDYQQTISPSGIETPLCELINRATFPGVQGTPYQNHIAAKAVFLKETLSSEYKTRQFKIIENAKALAKNLVYLGFDVLTDGTDNHMVLMSLGNFKKGLTAEIAQKCLEDCGIVVDAVRLAFEDKRSLGANNLRFGTAIVTKDGMGVKQMQMIAKLIEQILGHVMIVDQTGYKIDETFRIDIAGQIKKLCNGLVIS